MNYTTPVQQKLEELVNGTRDPCTVSHAEIRQVNPDYVSTLLEKLDTKAQQAVGEIRDYFLDEQLASELTGMKDPDTHPGHTILEFYAYLTIAKRIIYTDFH